ncbi:MAG: OB-fold nucleic acid binding domain-containing protein [Magnetovibrio sp.]|nr:OB-fold nucleic acid binding domain-containing protein [Magnetovibrio sp.]
MKITIHALSAFLFAIFMSNAVAAETVTVADLHAKRAELGGKEITIIGEVIKVNNGIMRRNFIHLQDGTGIGEMGKMIFTSQQTVEVGDKVEATGTVKLDTDFGMGYFYPTLIEQATFKPTQ